MLDFCKKHGNIAKNCVLCRSEDVINNYNKLNNKREREREVELATPT